LAAGVMSTTNKVTLLVSSLLAQTIVPVLQAAVTKGSNIAPSSLMAMESLSYVGIGWLVAGNSCIQPRRYIAFLPAAFCFYVANLLNYTAVKELGAPLYAVLNQLTLLTTAAVQRGFLGRQRSPAEWLALVQLVIGMSVFVLLQSSVDNQDANSGSLQNGLLAMGFIIPAQSFATVWMELQLKRYGDMPFFAQLHEINFFVLTFGLSVAAYDSMEKSFFTGWSITVLVLVACCFGRGALGTATVKQMGALANQIVNLGSILMVYLVNCLFFGHAIDQRVLLQMLVILMSVTLFLLSGRTEERGLPLSVEGPPILAATVMGSHGNEVKAE